MISGKKIFPDNLRLHALYLGKFNSVDALPGTTAEVAFIGRSNSGKSSLLRALLNSPKMPQVSSRPGSTRLMHLYKLAAREEEVGTTLADFPGYGYAQSSHFFRQRFSEMLANYLSAKRPVKALVLMMDSRRALQEEEMEIAAIAKQRRIPTLLILNKADQLNQKETSALIRSFGAQKDFFEILLVSAAKRQNLEYLHNFISSLG